MQRPLVLALLALLLTAPMAEGAWFSRGPVAVTVAHSHVGDMLRFDPFWPPDVRPLRPGTPPSGPTIIVHTEGFAQAEDAYGILRETTATVVEHLQGEQSHRALRCHALRGGAAEVRTEVLHGGMDYGWASSGGPGGSFERSSRQTLTHGGACPWANPAAGRTFTEGAQVHLSELMPHEAATRGHDPLSHPATATRFDERSALEFVFETISPVPAFIDETLHVVVADGLPGVVRFHGGSYTSELTGLARGDGVAVPVSAHARLPTTNPQGQLLPYGPLDFDDSGWRLPYPFAEALAEVRNDPSLQIGAWLDAHPAAYLLSASYQRRLLENEFPGMQVDGEWILYFQDDEDGTRIVETARARPPLGVLPVAPEWPAPLVRNRETGGSAEPWEWVHAPHGARIVSSATLAQVATRAGIATDDVQELHFALEQSGAGQRARITASDVADRERAGSFQGQDVEFDPFTGGYRSVYETLQQGEEPGPVLFRGASPPPLRDERTAPLAVLVGPIPPVAGGAAIAGLALLLLALKFGLMPFYARLTRERVLEHPARARLFERIRAAPGIRQQELIDFHGGGEGATRNHIDQLVKHHLVVRLHEQGFVAFYASGDVPPALARRAAILRSESTRRVYELLQAEPRLSLREAGARLGMSAPGVHRIKKKLEKAGLLPAAGVASAELVAA